MAGQALYYGMNALSHNVIMADRKKLKSANGMYLGSTGSGKSFAAKRELLNVFLTIPQDRIIVVDPMGEYAPLVRRLGGQVIEIAPDSPHHLNPMDVELNMAAGESPLSMKADFLLSLCEQVVGGKEGFRKKSQQEQAAAAKLRMESQGEKLEQAREKLAKQKPPKKPGPVKRIGRVASGSVHSFVHGKIFEVEQENVGTEGAHRSELVGETALRHGSRFVRRKVREHPAKVVRKAEARYTKYTADYHFHTAAQEHPELTKNALTRYWQKQRLRRQYRKQAKEAAKQGAAVAVSRFNSCFLESML